MLQVMRTLALCLDGGTGVMKGALLNLICCVLVNLTSASFIRSIVHSQVKKSCGPLI